MIELAVEPTSEERLVDLFTAHSSRVYGLVLARCGQPWLAEEITAQTFESAASLFSVGRGGEVTIAWLTTVARRRLVDHWRRDASRRRVSEVLSLNSAPVPQEIELDGVGPVWEALDSLSMRQRAVLVLRYLDGWSVSDIAEGLEISYSAAESLLARSRRSFRSSLEEKGLA